MKKPEIELIDLKEKIGKAEKEQDTKETYFITVVGGFIISTGFTIFIWYKRILDDYWYYASGLFGVLALIALILSFFAYKWEKEASKKLKDLKRQEKKLKEKINNS